jgi:hypothetical protein
MTGHNESEVFAPSYGAGIKGSIQDEYDLGSTCLVYCCSVLEASRLAQHRCCCYLIYNCAVIQFAVLRRACWSVPPNG